MALHFTWRAEPRPCTPCCSTQHGSARPIRSFLASTSHTRSFTDTSSPSSSTPLAHGPTLSHAQRRRAASCRMHAGSSSEAPSSTLQQLQQLQQQVLQGPPEEPVDMPQGAEERFWHWTLPSGLQARVRYFQAGSQGPHLLLLHGFGVGAYHWERNISELSQHCRVFAVDVLGQGSSWPVRPATPEDGLYISIDTWCAQLHDFARQVMGVEEGQPMYVAGNSLGGLLAVYLAARNPSLVKGVVLLNATPFWSFRPALAAPSQGWWGLMPSGFGTVPVQQGLKSVIERLWWNNLRKPATVRSMLQLVYSHPGSVDEDTVTRILQATEQPMALDVFSAIALAPKPDLGFDEALDKVQAPILMLYGREDPWVVPLWGQRLKRHKPSATYLELSPAGHCPHHEAPHTINQAMAAWIQGGHAPPVAEGEAMEVSEGPGRVVRVRNVGGTAGGPTNFLSRLVNRLWK